MTYKDIRVFVFDFPFNTITEIYRNEKQAILIYHPGTLYHYTITTHHKTRYMILHTSLHHPVLLYIQSQAIVL